MKISIIISLNLLLINSYGHLLASNQVWKSSDKTENDTEPFNDIEQFREKIKQQALSEYWSSYHRVPDWHRR